MSRILLLALLTLGLGACGPTAVPKPPVPDKDEHPKPPVVDKGMHPLPDAGSTDPK
jgi:hypothetical protein